MVVDNPYDPRKILCHKEKILNLSLSKRIYPITIEVDPVDGACNNKCIFCCFGNNKKNEPVFIKPKPLYKALEIAYKNGTKGVELVGGSEPTMHRHIEQIIDEISKIGLEVSIITNGLLLPRIYGIAEKLKYVRISLDAGTSQTYNKIHKVDVFEKVLFQIKNLVNLPNRPPKVGLAYLCVPQNSKEQEIMAFAELSDKLGVDYIVFRPAILKEGCDSSYLEEMENFISKVKSKYSNKYDIYSSVSSRWKISREKIRNRTESCKTCQLTGIIKANGDVPFCNLLRNQESSILGNIYESNYDEIWEGHIHNNLLNSNNPNNCPIPCKADDYWEVIENYKNDLKRENFSVKVSPKSDQNFV